MGKGLLVALATALLLLCRGVVPAGAVEIYVPDLKAKAGQKVVVPVMIDQAVKLAGVKLIMTYDARALQYMEGEKTKQTTSFMHIVNDRNPGRLIIVMAGARGITGHRIALVNINFQLKKNAPDTNTRLDFVTVQLMTEQLTEVKGTFKGGVIEIIP